MDRGAKLAIVFIASLLNACATKYVTPGAGANLTAITSPDIAAAMKTEPAASFPARIAIVRVEGAGYRSYSATGYGRGQFSIVTARDVENEEDFAVISKMPQVAAIAFLNKLLLPSDVISTQNRRIAAATLKADILLMYSFDTAFWIDKKN